MKFFVPGRPVPKARPRFGGGAVYTPAKTAAYERLVRLCYLQAGGECLSGALCVRIRAFYRPGKEMLKEIKKTPTEAHRMTSRPDVDNIAKSVLDALNGVAYEDDKQIDTLTVSKEYTDGEQGIEVEINGADTQGTFLGGDDDKDS